MFTCVLGHCAASTISENFLEQSSLGLSVCSRSLAPKAIFRSGSTLSTFCSPSSVRLNKFLQLRDGMAKRRKSPVLAMERLKNCSISLSCMT